MAQYKTRNEARWAVCLRQLEETAIRAYSDRVTPEIMRPDWREAIRMYHADRLEFAKECGVPLRED